MGIFLITAAMLAAAQDAEIVEVEVVDDAEPQVLFMQIAKTRAETEERAAARFDERDKDGNGYLEGDERRAMGLRMPHMAMMRHGAMSPMPEMPHRMKMDPAEMFAKIDSDGDGSISKEEFEAHHKDHDGHAMPRVKMHRIEGGEGEGERQVVVNRWTSEDGGEAKEEVIVRRLGEGGEWTTDDGHKVMLERAKKLAEAANEDADGDGRVSRDEAIGKALERFDAMDKDGDGMLDEGENVFVLKRVVERKD